jgi:glycosyltransferase involved in cell wall biosynthesis
VQYLLIALCIAIGIQLFFLIFYWIQFSRSAKAVDSSKAPGFSVIVCAHDEEENLKQLIPLLLAQQYTNFEVIVVDDRSNDGTYDFLLHETKRHASLRMVHVRTTPDHIHGKKYALTLGIKAARFDWVVLTDADCRPSSNWLSSLAPHIAEPTDFVLGASPYQKTKGLLNTFIRFEAAVTWMQCAGFALGGMPYMGLGRNLAYRKSVFLDNKGFHGFLGTTGGDDDLFVNRHARSGNTAVMLGATSVVMSVPKKTWADFFRQKIRHLAVGKKYKWKHRMVLGVFMLTWVGSWLLAGVLATTPYAGFAFGLLMLKILVFMATLHTVSKKTGFEFEAWKTLFLDFIYAFYYLTTSPVALLTKRIQWKKN